MVTLIVSVGRLYLRWSRKKQVCFSRVDAENKQESAAKANLARASCLAFEPEQGCRCEPAAHSRRTKRGRRALSRRRLGQGADAAVPGQGREGAF